MLCMQFAFQSEFQQTNDLRTYLGYPLPFQKAQDQ